MVSNKLSSRQRYLLCLLSGYTKAIPLYCSVCMVVRMWQQVATPSEMLCQAFHVLCIAAHCGQDAGINLIRNPLSARNPGVSRRRFETPPPSSVRCCLAVFLETHVGDCLSTCRAPAVCPAVNKCSASLSPLPSPPSLGPQRLTLKAHPLVVRNDSLTPIMIPTARVHLQPPPSACLPHCS